jgi:hypothetical protein
MALDRGDLSFASKEVSRGMANPMRGDEARLKRVLRYLRGCPRAYYEFPWQEKQNTISGYSDSDWAGCTRTRKSTSGGVIMIGRHTLAQWSWTQATVALSSAEAELNATVKMMAEALGMKNMYEAINRRMKVTLYTDSNACKGILQREGCGKVKHLEARQLWTQEFIARKIVEVKKIPREFNPSDAFTHHWGVADGKRHFDRIGLKFATNSE